MDHCDLLVSSIRPWVQENPNNKCGDRGDIVSFLSEDEGDTPSGQVCPMVARLRVAEPNDVPGKQSLKTAVKAFVDKIPSFENRGVIRYFDCGSSEPNAICQQRLLMAQRRTQSTVPPL